MHPPAALDLCSHALGPHQAQRVVGLREHVARGVARDGHDGRQRARQARQVRALARVQLPRDLRSRHRMRVTVWHTKCTALVLLRVLQPFARAGT